MRVNLDILKKCNKHNIFLLPHKIYRVTNTQ